MLKIRIRKHICLKKIIVKPIYDVIRDCFNSLPVYKCVCVGGGGRVNSEMVSIYHRIIFFLIGRKTNYFLEIGASYFYSLSVVNILFI